MREPDGYAVRVRGELAGEGRLRPGALLAIAEPSVLARIGGEPAVDPVYGLAGRWIEPAHRDAAQQAGALLFDAVSVIGSHLAEVARRRAASLLGRQELQTMIEHLRASVPTLVKEIGGEALPLATVQRVLHELLRERVWPRDPVATLEAIVDAAATTREPRELVESARRSLVPAQLRRRGLPRLAPLILAPELETELAAVWSPESTLAAPRPELALQLRSQVEAHLARAGEEGAAVVCTAAVRGGLAQILRRLGVHVPVYSYVEIPPEIELVPAGVVSAPSSRPQ
jgi:flagellar biosynthesis protein FlhA